MTGIEPALPAWKAGVLPLNYTDIFAPPVMATGRCRSFQTLEVFAARTPQRRWQRWPDSNRRISESKSDALPLGYISVFGRAVAQSGRCLSRPETADQKESESAVITRRWRPGPDSNRLPLAVLASVLPEAPPGHGCRHGYGGRIYPGAWDFSRSSPNSCSPGEW